MLFCVLTNGTHFRVLHHFGAVQPSGQLDGTNPYGTLLRASDGWLYGTAQSGGENQHGIVFKITREGMGYRVIHHFGASETDGGSPSAGVIEGTDGYLYGTTFGGGRSGLGTVYKLNKDGGPIQILFNLADSPGTRFNPRAGVTQGRDGYLYGLTTGQSGEGDAFRLRTDGTGFQILATLGSGPWTELTEGADGHIYGVGSFASGNMYRLLRGGATGPWDTEAINLYTPDNSQYAASGPYGRPLLAGDGAFYGVALNGGPGDGSGGLLFRWTPEVIAPTPRAEADGIEDPAPPRTASGLVAGRFGPKGKGQSSRLSLTAAAELNLTTTGPGLYAGRSVALEDDILVVGAPFGTNLTYAGSATVFARGAGGWLEQTNLAPLPADGTWAFGYAVALSGTNLVVGALEYLPTNQNSGSAFVFTSDGTNWLRQQRLQPSDGAPDDQFGAAVAMNGETIVVGAPLRDEGSTNDGAAYVFVREGGAWAQQAKLLATVPQTNAFFGGAVALDGDTTFISAPQGAGLSAEDRPGEVHVFTRSGSTWSFRQKLTSPSQFPRDLFGASVAVRNDTLVIGAPGIIPTGPPPDANFGKRTAYVFARSGNHWIERQRLTSADLAPFDIFATSVGVAEDYVVVGAPHSWPFSATPRDAAYGFQRSGSQWQQSLRMTPTTPQLMGAFGFALAADGGTLAVGAPAHTNSTAMRGSVFLFELPPVLHLAQDGSDAVITWSATTAGYALETTTNFAAPNSWQAVSPTPVGNTHRAMIEASARFYRLKRQ